MPDNFLTRLKHAWNVFQNPIPYSSNIGPSYAYRPDRLRFSLSNERSIISALYNRIAIDVSAIDIMHVRLDEDGRFSNVIDSGLNNCLTLEANKDQTARSFMQDVVMSLCDEGVVAIVPVDTSINPLISGSYDILTMRTAKIVGWYPDHVRINIYNDRRGIREDVVVEKRTVAIVENPLYAVMNEPNSILKRLVEKLNTLDVIDQQSSSGKLDLLIQLPFMIKTDARKKQAEQRRLDIEEQLAGSKHGIAYIDATEKVTQLNRPVENNLMAQIEYLTRMLYGQLGLDESIFYGTANEATMLNYYNRTIEPMLSAITGSMKRTFLTKTARSQRQTIKYFKNTFNLVPAKDMADIADKFTRNEILTSNEIRDIIGYKPSKEKNADELRNKNLNPAKEPETDSDEKNDPVTEGEKFDEET